MGSSERHATCASCGATWHVRAETHAQHLGCPSGALAVTTERTAPFAPCPRLCRIRRRLERRGDVRSAPAGSRAVTMPLPRMGTSLSLLVTPAPSAPGAEPLPAPVPMVAP